MRLSSNSRSEPQNQFTRSKLVWLGIGVALLLLSALLPPRDGLSVAGQRVLGITLFAVIMWISEAVPYEYASVGIVLFLAILLGFSPIQGTTGNLLGSAKALQIAVSGFTSTGTILVTAALLLAAAIQITGLEKRITFRILKVFGPTTHRIFAGIMLVMLVLDFLIPSIIARASIGTPLAMGLVTTFDIDRKSTFARNLLICVAMSASISGIGVLSAGIPNVIALSLIEKYLHHSITWIDWLKFSMPFCVAMMLALYFLLTRLNKFEFNEIPGGRQGIDEALAKLGPMSAQEIRMSLISILTIAMWATEHYLKIDVDTVAILAVLLVLSPYIGVTSWRELSNRANVGGIVLVASAAVSLGQALLDTGGATWLVKTTLGNLGLQRMPPWVMMVILVAALIPIRFAFASITSASATLIPLVLALLLSFENPTLPISGMALIATYTVYFSFVLPVSAPQNMIAYGTNTFNVRDFMKIGIPLSIISLLLLVLFWCTYWRWLAVI
jgi:sodium-dependent dicarboxylate transporter 2/3/5